MTDENLKKTWQLIPPEKKKEWSELVTEYKRECIVRECIFPDKTKCFGKVAKNHSVQKGKILEKIAHKGEVMTFDSRESYTTGDFEKSGKKIASIFFGFCDGHDSSLFSKIENYDYIGNVEQNFLHSYRACAKEYLDRKFALNINEKLLRDHKISMTDREYSILQSGIRLENFLIKSLLNQLRKFHNELLKEYPRRDFRIISTMVKELPYMSLIAVNAMVELKHRKDTNNEYIPKFFNIFPQNNKTYILLSYFSDDEPKLSNLISHINSLKNSHLEIFFSNLILSQCRNIFISPLKWNNILPDIKERIVPKLIINMVKSVKEIDIPFIPSVNLFKLLKE